MFRSSDRITKGKRPARFDDYVPGSSPKPKKANIDQNMADKTNATMRHQMVPGEPSHGSSQQPLSPNPFQPAGSSVPIAQAHTHSPPIPQPEVSQGVTTQQLEMMMTNMMQQIICQNSVSQV